MIKAIGVKGGKPLYIFGLSAGNCSKLLEGKPIVIDLDVMAREMADLPLRGAVVICGGQTEEHIQAYLEKMLDLSGAKRSTHNDEN